jgi:hypothetical protein
MLERLIPVPEGIDVLSQLMISTSRVTDFKIDKINREAINLLKHPDSFRTTLVQIANEVYGAFTKAHTNMEMIRLQMAQVPDLVTNSIKMIKSRNKTVINKDLPICLASIKKAANDGLKLSTEVAQAFDLLGQLIRQVILAIVASQGAKEREIQNVNEIVGCFVKGGIKTVNNHQLEANEKKQKDLEFKREGAQENVQRSQQQLEEASQLEFFDIFTFGLSSTIRVNNAQYNTREADEQLQKIEDEAKRVAAERDKISVEFVKNFKTMSKTLQIKVDQELSQNEMIILLKEGISKLSQLNSNWTELTMNFNSINNYIEQITQKTLTNFAEDAKDAQENTFLVDFITNSIEKTLKLSYTTHRAAEMYVEFSNTNILKSLSDMHQSKNALYPF